MNELSTPMSHVIVFHDGSHKYITAQQASLIFQASASAKTITTPQLGLISIPSIAKIVEIDDFYEQYPDKRPESRPEWKEPREEYKSIEQQALADESRRNGLVKGIKEYIAEADRRGEPAINAREILSRWEKGQRNVTDTRSYHQKTVDKYRDKPNLTPSEKAHYEHALSKLQEFKVI